MYKNLSTIFILTIFITSCAVLNNSNSNSNESLPLPMDPKIKTGVLDNGLTYYVLENAKPEKRAELLLLVDAGSILEEDHQQGVAHFVEHMAFNGTKNFPKQELVNYLESIGLKFGPDLNAFTSFDMTVYMLQVPTDDTEKFDTAFNILEDWAHNLTMDHEEIDKERGVVLEELRIGKGARERMMNKKLPVYLKGSKYADRLPIGKEDIIKTFDYSAAEDFYKDWYRPDLMAVVAVGDFDGEKVEEQIKMQFSQILVHPNPKERKEYDVPLHDETRYLVVSDPEATGSSVGVSYKFPKQNSSKSLSDLRKEQLTKMFIEMFNNRLTERTKNPESALIYGYNYVGSWVRSVDGLNIVAGVKPGMIEQGLEEVLVELERVLRFGFSESEFEREKRAILKNIETQYNERDKTESADLRWQFLDIFFENGNSIGIEKAYQIMNKMIPSLKVSDLNSYIQLIKKSSSRVITADCPEKEGFDIPKSEDLERIDNLIKDLEINPYEDKVITSPLVDEVPLPTKIKDYTSYEEVGVMEFLLENGVRVLMKPTDFKNDEILFSAYSPGGHSLVEDSKFMSAKYASDIIIESGVAGFTKIELDKFLSDKQVEVSPFIREMKEGLNGSSSVSDVETMFQLIYQYFHKPKKNKDAFNALIQNWNGMIENKNARPENVYRDSISIVMSDRHFRGRPMSSKTLNEIDMDVAFEVYMDRFSDASDFTFVFVGSIDPNTFMPLVLTYLGNLPSTNRIENWKDVGIKYPKGDIEKIVNKGIEEKSSVQLRFTGDFDWSFENRFLFKSMTSAFRIKLREILREDMGGTYGVWVGGYPEKDPKGSYQSIVAFGCGPENVELMVTEVFKQIEILKKEGISQSYLEKVIEADKVEYEKNIQENTYWLEVLSAYDQYEEPFRQIVDRNHLYELVTNQNIKASAQKYFNFDNVLKAYLYPENFNSFGKNINTKNDDMLSQNLENIESDEKLDYMGLDSTWIDYRIRPGYTLSLIAYEEYGNSNKWKTIYSWNKDKIGNNPNRINPYHKLDLLKPNDNLVDNQPDYYIYKVKKGETLWTISKNLYGDEYAWIILFWDNEALIEDNFGILKPDMELKVRQKIWN